MPTEEQFNEFRNWLDKPGQLLALMLKAAEEKGGEGPEARLLEEQMMELIQGHFTCNESKALVNFSFLVYKTIETFREYFEDCYRDKITVVEGSDTVN